MPRDSHFYIHVFNHVHSQLSKVKTYKTGNSGRIKQLHNFLDLQ